MLRFRQQLDTKMERLRERLKTMSQQAPDAAFLDCLKIKCRPLETRRGLLPDARVKKFSATISILQTAERSRCVLDAGSVIWPLLPRSSQVISCRT